MIKSYRWKLVAAYLLVITFLLVLLGGIGYINFKNYYLNNMEERLTKEAFLVADMCQYRIGDNATTRSYQDICETAAQDSTARVTIVNAEGLVLGDSSAEPDKMENHSTRPEVYAALHGGIGIEMRYSDTLDMNMLYVAVPLNTGDVKGAVRIAMPLAALQVIYNNVFSGMLMAALLCGLLAFLLSFMLAQYFSHPLRDITEAVQDMARGNLKRRTSFHSADEMGILAQAFNDMGQHIEQSMYEVSEVKNRLEALLNNTVNGIVMIGNDGRVVYANPAAICLLGLGTHFVGKKHVELITTYELLAMIDEAKISLHPVKRTIVLHTLGARIIEANVVPIKNEALATQDILVVLNDITELKRLEQVRKDFVANVSHELKTPVTSISGFAETLLDEGGKNSDNVMEFTTIIYDEAQRLSNLINGLLELSKLESDEFKLNLQTVSINKLVSATVERMSKLAGLRNILVNYTEPKDILELTSDPALIDQILMNLLDNAIKYSADRGQVDIKVEDLSDKVRISVKDNGIGIPEKEMARIFERFYRVDKARSRKTGGTGLGLAIVKHLVENLKGQVTVESTVGKGSTFTITLPK
ncbi:MAG: ATP-binding protein [Syntrophomonas sp.]|nr:ATP-binding protein [Syntrophomonas sp.]